METIHSKPVFVVTGAGKGIGEAVVREIILRKAQFQSPRLILTSRTAQDLSMLQADAHAQGLKCEVLASELSDQPDASVALAIQTFGRIDFLIHAAGVGRFKPLDELTRDDLQFVMKTNVEASFLLMQATYAQMKQQKNGHIVFITSVAADKAFKESAVYCMSKAAQHALIEVLRLYAYEDGVKITEVKPGAVLTPMWGSDLPEEMKSKMMRPKDIAQNLIDLLLLPKSATVETLTIRPLAGDL